MPRIICSILLLVGLAFYCYSTRLDYYTDTKAKEKLDGEASSNPGLVVDAQWKDHYYTEVENLKTNKLFYEDFGSGLGIVSLTVLLFLFRKRIKSFSDFKSVRSLTRKQIFIFSNLIWLIMFPSTYWYYMYRGARGDYPWFADTVIIPIMSQIEFFFIAFIPLNIFIWLASINNHLPTNIFIRPSVYNSREIAKEIFWSFWLLLNLFFTYNFVLEGDHLSIPVNLFFTFVLLTLRAGQINKPIVFEPA
jgi:hypothetical protein